MRKHTKYNNTDRFALKYISTEYWCLPLKQVVVIIGFAASAYDISRDIATVAKEVHLATRNPDVRAMKLANHDNMWQHKMVC